MFLALLNEPEGVAEDRRFRNLEGGRLVSSTPSNIKRGCFSFFIDGDDTGELKTDNSERDVTGLGGCVLDMVLLELKRCYGQTLLALRRHWQWRLFFPPCINRP